EGFAGNARHHRGVRTQGEEDGVVPTVQLPERLALTDADPELEIDAEPAQPLELMLDHCLGEAVCRNAVAQDAATRVVCVVDRHRVAAARELAGAGDARGTGPNHRHSLAAWRLGWASG